MIQLSAEVLPGTPSAGDWKHTLGRPERTSLQQYKKTLACLLELLRLRVLTINCGGRCTLGSYDVHLVHQGWSFHRHERQLVVTYSPLQRQLSITHCWILSLMLTV